MRDTARPKLNDSEAKLSNCICTSDLELFDTITNSLNDSSTADYKSYSNKLYITNKILYAAV